MRGRKAGDEDGAGDVGGGGAGEVVGGGAGEVAGADGAGAVGGGAEDRDGSVAREALGGDEDLPGEVVGGDAAVPGEGVGDQPAVSAAAIGGETGVAGAVGEAIPAAAGAATPGETGGAGKEHVRWTPGPLEALGERAWLVLGGGGLKGLSHVGAWQAFEEAGVRFEGIVGTSIGALVGACVAGGMGWPELVPLALALRREDIVRFNRRAVWINGVRQESLFLGQPLRDYIERVLPVKAWDELKLPLQVNAVNLETGRTEWFGTGANTEVPLVEAIYASAALPVFYPPARLNGGYYVDGGTEHTFPLHRAAELGATGIVGVDVGAGERSDPGKVLAQGMLSVHQRVFAIMSWRTRANLVASWEGPPLLYVRPNLEGYQTFDFEAAQYFLEEGYRATRAALLEGL